MSGKKRAHRYFPDTPEYQQAMSDLYQQKYGTLPPPGYFGGGRNDGMNILTESESALRSRLTLGDWDPDFGIGYEIVDPAPSRNPLGRARAQKLGYNREMQYLAILMRDGKLIGYPDVTWDEWAELQNFSSTSDYIDSVLTRYVGGNWEDVTGQPPQSLGQSFGQGSLE